MLDSGDASFTKYKILVGKNIAKIRTSKNLTREQIDAGKYAVPVRTLADIELGTTNPTLLNLWKISKQLDVDLTELLTIKK